MNTQMNTIQITFQKKPEFENAAFMCQQISNDYKLVVKFTYDYIECTCIPGGSVSELRYQFGILVGTEHVNKVARSA